MGEETRAAVRAIEMVERKDRVLIVEDEDNARKGYEQLLQRWGCDVVSVEASQPPHQVRQRRMSEVLRLKLFYLGILGA
jgi:DNA-binding NtrC family response regulator